jgi:hypothetical protein
LGCEKMEEGKAEEEMEKNTCASQFIDFDL